MSLLEGHASFVMNEVAKDHVSDLARMRNGAGGAQAAAGGMERSFQRAIGFDKKIEQYDAGERFVREVVSRSGMEGFNRVWLAPEGLPTVEEIAEPDRLGRARRRELTCLAGLRRSPGCWSGSPRRPASTRCSGPATSSSCRAAAVRTRSACSIRCGTSGGCSRSGSPSSTSITGCGPIRRRTPRTSGPWPAVCRSRSISGRRRRATEGCVRRSVGVRGQDARGRGRPTRDGRRIDRGRSHPRRPSRDGPAQPDPWDRPGGARGDRPALARPATAGPAAPRGRARGGGSVLPSAPPPPPPRPDERGPPLPPCGDPARGAAGARARTGAGSPDRSRGRPTCFGATATSSRPQRPRPLATVIRDGSADEVRFRAAQLTGLPPQVASRVVRLAAYRVMAGRSAAPWSRMRSRRSSIWRKDGRAGDEICPGA